MGCKNCRCNFDNAFCKVYNSPQSRDGSRIISLSEKKSNYKLHNDSGLCISRYHIDGGLCDSMDHEKCDYGIFTDLNELFLIELKGRNINHAIEQIDHTIDFLKLPTKFRGMKVKARIVATKAPTPDMMSTKRLSLEKKLKSLGGNLLIKTIKYEEHI